MTRSLPASPSVRFLHEQAKDLLKAHGRGDPGVCGTLRLLRRFHAADDGAILAGDVALNEVQFALAMDYGFPSWPAMMAHVEKVAASAAADGPVGDGDVRLVLEGVPKPGFHRRLCPFPGCVEALLDYLGRPQPYDYLMGVTGAAFRRIWNRDDGGNVDLMYLRPEPHRLLFDAIGIDCRVIAPTDRDGMIQAVTESIAGGKPVIAFGIIGPPEAGLVCGYDRGGEVLLGHSYFDRTGGGAYYEQEDWYEQVQQGYGMIVLGEDKPRPSGRQVLGASLQWAIDLARVSRRENLPDHICGLAAYDAWADALEVDSDYATSAPVDLDGEFGMGEPVIVETRIMVHGDQACMLRERVHAAGFLRSMAEHAPEAADHLRSAADLYAEVGAVSVWPWRAHNYEDAEVQEGLRDHDVRRGLAQSIRKAGDLESRAVRHLEQARDAMEREME